MKVLIATTRDSRRCLFDIIGFVLVAFEKLKLRCIEEKHVGVKKSPMVNHEQ